jgi:hypothetical protein
MQASDWSALRHAYGPATDVPELLTRARSASAPVKYRDEPWFSLWSALCHQGDVYTASYAAVPELVQIAAARRSEPRVAAECLFLAASIELERGASISRTPPPAIPAQLVEGFEAARTRGGRLTEELQAAEPDPTSGEMLAICAAVFAGDLARARILADGPDDAEVDFPLRAP